MRFSLPFVLILLFGVTLISCGKEAATGNSPKASPRGEKIVADRFKEAWQELWRAVSSNDTVALRVVLFDNPDLQLDKYLPDGDTLLTYSIKHKFPLVRNILLERGARTDLVTQHLDSIDFTPLMLAAHLGDNGAISALIGKGTSLNTQDESLGDTALHKAIKNGYDEAAKTLIQAGANLRLKNFADETPMKTADNLGRKEISDYMKGLVELSMGVPSLAVFEQILINGDIVNYRTFLTNHRDLVPGYASINPLVIVLDSPNELHAFEIIQSLLILKLPANGPDNSDTTPMIRAVKLKRSNIAELLQRYKPDLQKLDRDDRPALYYAIKNNDEKMVNFLMSNGALEKFEKIRRGRKITFKGCRVADDHQSQLKTEQEQMINKIIQSHLGCRWTG